VAMRDLCISWQRQITLEFSQNCTRKRMESPGMRSKKGKDSWMVSQPRRPNFCLDWHSVARSLTVLIQFQESASRALRRAKITLTIAGRVKARPQVSGKDDS
jgi:hypothetical protein